MPEGTRLALLGEHGKWRLVKLDDGREGWAHGDFLRFDDPSGGPGKPLEATSGKRSHFVTNVQTFLFLRGRPTERSVEKAQLGPGTRLTVLGRQDEWLQVEVEDLDGLTGWAHSNYVGCCQ